WQGPVPGRVPIPAPPWRTRPYWFDGRDTRPGTSPVRPAAPRARREVPMPERSAPPPPTRRGAKIALAPLARSAPTAGNLGPAPARPAPGPETEALVPAGLEVLDPSPETRVPVPAAADLVAVVRAHVGTILGLSAEQVAPAGAFADLGLDSIFRMDL